MFPACAQILCSRHVIFLLFLGLANYMHTRLVGLEPTISSSILFYVRRKFHLNQNSLASHATFLDSQYLNFWILCVVCSCFQAQAHILLMRLCHCSSTARIQFTCKLNPLFLGILRKMIRKSYSNEIPWLQELPSHLVIDLSS